MSEKKKRERPTWTMVRGLQAELDELRELNSRILSERHIGTAEMNDCIGFYEEKLSDQIEGTSLLVQDCDGWRDKYRTLLARHGQDGFSQSHLQSLYSAMMDNVKQLGKELEAAREMASKYRDAFEELQCRGLIARIINKKIEV